MCNVFNTPVVSCCRLCRLGCRSRWEEHKLKRKERKTERAAENFEKHTLGYSTETHAHPHAHAAGKPAHEPKKVVEVIKVVPKPGQAAH